MLSNTGAALLVILAGDVGLQGLAFLLSSFPNKTEKFYDLSGAATYMLCLVLGVFVRFNDDSVSDLVARQITAAILTLIWSLRLGSFLFSRILRDGKDGRFDDLKKNMFSWAVPWTFQVIWVFLTALPVWIVLANPGGAEASSFGASEGVGLALWILGFSIEVLADHQKSAWKRARPQEFIRTGLWSWSRHPNYFGEILLWVGMLVLCARGFSEPWQWVGIVSPIFVASLICFVSGIPLLEKSSDKRYGGLPEYQAYKKCTSILVPFPPRSNPMLNKSASVKSKDSGSEEGS